MNIVSIFTSTVLYLDEISFHPDIPYTVVGVFECSVIIKVTCPSDVRLCNVCQHCFSMRLANFAPHVTTFRYFYAGYLVDT